ncbi:MAG: transcriptional regulator, partial [Archangium sp.]
ARMERGLILPSVPSLLRVCRALGVDANSLLGLAADTPPQWLAQPAPPAEEPPALRKLLRFVRQLGTKQLNALTSVARLMRPAPATRGPREPNEAAH